MTAQQVLSNAASRHGFLHEDELAILASHEATRLTPCLVRCGCGRFTAPAQDVAHFIAIIERDAKVRANTAGTDYVRDVSLVSR